MKLFDKIISSVNDKIGRNYYVCYKLGSRWIKGKILEGRNGPFFRSQAYEIATMCNRDIPSTVHYVEKGKPNV